MESIMNGKRAISQGRRAQSKSKKIIKVQKPLQLDLNNPTFCDYYQMQLSMTNQQSKYLSECLKTKIPLLIRLNSSIPNYKMFCRKLSDIQKIIQKEQLNVDTNCKQFSKKDFLQKLIIKQLKLDKNQIVFQISASQSDLKRVEHYSQLNRFLQKSTENRLISKQDLSSIFIPLLLDIQQNDFVLDLCAAPGYKTSQILQNMCNKNKLMKNGCVTANDAQARRVQMLTQKVHDSGTINMLAINHSGQFLPQFFKIQNGFKKKIRYNKILCDVPSSGDGLIRSLPSKLANWKAKEGIQLHSLQLALLMKSIEVLSNDGLVVYSTSSLNPIQNQAVVAALFSKVQRGLQIIDIHEQFGIKGRRGLQKWKVCTDSKIKPLINQNPFEKKQNIQIQQKESQIPIHQISQSQNYQSFPNQFEVLNNYEQVKIQQFSSVRQTMFPLAQSKMKDIQIRNCMRVMPNDNNSNGFFVALLRKKQNFLWKFQKKGEQQMMIIDSDDESQNNFLKQNMPLYQHQIAKQTFDERNALIEDYSDSQTQRIQSINNADFWNKRKGKFKGNKYGFLTQNQFQSIQKFYGLDNSVKKLLFVRESSGLKKKVFLISEGIKKLLDADINKDLRLVKMGCKVLQRGKQSFAGSECVYRLCQDGIHFMINLMQKRKIKVPLNFFRMVLSIHSVLHHDIEDEIIKKQFKQLGQGSFVIYIDEDIEGQRVLDGMVGQNFKNSFHLMISKEDVASLNIRYL